MTWQVSAKVTVTISKVGVTTIAKLKSYHQAVTLVATLGLAALSGTMAGMAVKYLYHYHHHQHNQPLHHHPSNLSCGMSPDVLVGKVFP